MKCDVRTQEACDIKRFDSRDQKHEHKHMISELFAAAKQSLFERVLRNKSRTPAVAAGEEDD